MSRVRCLNPWDSQSKRLYKTDGIYCTLHARQNGGGQADGVIYSIEGNVVDRISSKNGKGWCENVSPTLNTQDRHAVVFEAYGVISKGNGETILSKEKHMSLSCGGGQAGQGYPAVLYQTGEKEWNGK